MSEFTRNAFRIHVALQDTHTVGSHIAVTATDLPSDYVIQISLSRNDFANLFRDPSMNAQNPYNEQNLLNSFNNFWDASKENHNTLANSIYSLISNEYDDVDINPVNLKLATQSDFSGDGTNSQIFDYFHLSNTTIASEADSNIPLKVYQAIAAELRLLLSNIPGDSNNTDSYEALENEYGYIEFWKQENLQVGDSIFVEGSFKIPTESIEKRWGSYTPVGNDQGANLPCILRFMVVEDADAQYSLPLPAV